MFERILMDRAGGQKQVLAPEQAPPRPWAVVLGAPPRRNRTDAYGPLLLARLQAGLFLWESGRVEHLFVTGTKEETDRMAGFFEDAGVPDAVVQVDPLAKSTLDNIRHAHHHGITDALVVTNTFHLPRALYLSARLGLCAVGVDAGPVWPVSRSVRLRESVSCLVALVRRPS